MRHGLCVLLILIVGVVLFFSGRWYGRAHPAPISQTSAPTFAGLYRCHGWDPYLEKTYTGTVKVTAQNAVYRLDMKYDTGEIALGTGGMYAVDDMSVVFQDINDPKVIGLERYKFSHDLKTMSGYWVYLGQDKLGKEICERS